MAYMYIISGGIVVGLVGLFLTRFVKPENTDEKQAVNSGSHRR